MRPVRITATVMVTAALAVTGCASRTTDQTSSPVSSGPSSVTSTHSLAGSTTQQTAGSAETTNSSGAIAAKARCAISPKTGPAGSRVTLTCRGFVPSERVTVSFLAGVLTTTKATTGGDVAASFAVPSGFAGSHYPGRKDTFQAKGSQSGRVASATFTVTG
jgi:hypothetical protein